MNRRKTREATDDTRQHNYMYDGLEGIEDCDRSPRRNLRSRTRGAEVLRQPGIRTPTREIPHEPARAWSRSDLLDKLES